MLRHRFIPLIASISFSFTPGCVTRSIRRQPWTQLFLIAYSNTRIFLFFLLPLPCFIGSVFGFTRAIDFSLTKVQGSVAYSSCIEFIFTFSNEGKSGGPSPCSFPFLVHKRCKVGAISPPTSKNFHPSTTKEPTWMSKPQAL